MDIFSVTDRDSVQAPSEYFTGKVWMDFLMEAPHPSRVRALRVTFEPGSKTNWHSHPLGQTLHVLFGVGYIQIWGQPVREIRPGDTIWIDADEKHWHGATSKHAMSHIAIQEELDGVQAKWMEPVSSS